MAANVADALSSATGEAEIDAFVRGLTLPERDALVAEFARRAARPDGSAALHNCQLLLEILQEDAIARRRPLQDLACRR